MNKRILFFAIFIAVVGCASAMLLMRANTLVTAQPVIKKEVLATAVTLPVGSFLEEGNLVWKVLETNALDEGVIEKGANGKKPADVIKEVVGAVVTAPLKKGDYLLVKGNIIPHSDSNFLSAVLAPGMRAISIKIDSATSLSGFIRPGNQVDVLLTGKLETNGVKAIGLPASTTLIENARVIAVEKNSIANEQVATTKGGNKQTATLEVRPKDAEVLSLAQNLGDLSLSLRSLREADAVLDQENSGMTTASELVTIEKRERSASTVKVMYGTEKSLVSPK